MKIKKLLGIVLVILLFGSFVGAYQLLKKPEHGLVIDLPNPDRVLGRNRLVSWLAPKYQYYIQVQVLTPDGFKTVYEGTSRGRVLVPSSEISRLRSMWKDVNPGVLVDVWVVNSKTGESHEVGTFSTTIAEDAINGLKRLKLQISKKNLTTVSEMSKEVPITPARGFFAGYRWRTKREYLREDDYPNGMYLPVLILDNRRGKATVAGAYKVEVLRSSSSSSGIALGFSTTIIRGSRLSSRSEASIERGIGSGEIRIELKKGNEFIRTIIDDEVKNVKPGQIGIITIKGTPYIALQVLQRCYVDEFRHWYCFDTDKERIFITVMDVERRYDPQENAYFVETASFVNPPRGIYPAGNMDRLINDNAGDLKKLTTLYGEQQQGRSFYMENFLYDHTTYSNTYIPVLAIAIAFQPEAWPEFLLGLSAVGGVYITNEEHEIVRGSFAIKDESQKQKTSVEYLVLRYSVRGTNHFTKFPFAYLRFE
ncbi:hypothetical protein A3L11_04710 [Thermococcus siculi]|uniref:Uncharacterized protein n=1 Tax=Thermococcus siculi TaxID=72803 RepID=A0A2Z2MXD3_9EURY|nr:hypothetical protein [Thermococcus siculi]ASJ08570.1 hypothetical protein A3L11_04710 [Thermococcus siculi]